MPTRSAIGARFAVGALLALAAFVAVNLLVAHLRSDCGLPGLFGIARCADDISRVGFPLQFYEVGGFAYRRIVDAPALGLDVLSGLGIALLSGLFAGRARSGPRAGAE